MNYFPLKKLIVACVLSAVLDPGGTVANIIQCIDKFGLLNYGGRTGDSFGVMTCKKHLTICFNSIIFIHFIRKFRILSDVLCFL